MKQTIIWLVIVGTLFGIIFWTRPSGGIPHASLNASADKLSPLVAKELVYDFGTIKMSDGNVSHMFEISNPTDRDIKIARIHTSCMCTNAFIELPTGEKGPFGMEGMGYVPPANQIVKAGDSINIKVVYDPNAHGPAGVGRIDRFVMLTDDAGNQFQLEIKAIATP